MMACLIKYIIFSIMPLFSITLTTNKKHDVAFQSFPNYLIKTTFSFGADMSNCSIEMGIAPNQKGAGYMFFYGSILEHCQWMIEISDIL